MSDKKVVSSSTTCQTTTSKEVDGTIVRTVTTTITDKYSDGSTGVRTKVEVFKESPKPGTKHPHGSGPHVPSTGADPASSKAPKAEITTDDQFIQEALTAHNTHRAKHGSPPLVVNKELCKIAQAWANRVAAQGKMEHNNTGYGENVYWNTENITGNVAVDGWYSEIKDFNWNKLEGQKGCGHFTQVIWKSTKELGIAKALSPKGYTFVVANYNPPGNFVNKYSDNICKAA